MPPLLQVLDFMATKFGPGITPEGQTGAGVPPVRHGSNFKNDAPNAEFRNIRATLHYLVDTLASAPPSSRQKQ